MMRTPVRTLAGAVPLALVAEAAEAHAFAQRYDLPLPLWLYLVGAGAAVAVSFLIAALFVRDRAETLPTPRLELLQTPVGRVIAHPGVLFLIRLLSVLWFALLIAAGLFGTQDYALVNILPTSVWIIWWVGLAFVSALLGDVWALLNPWRIIAEWVARAWPGAAPPRRVPPAHAGVWPAVVLFLVFAWAELVWPSRSVPASLALGVLAYSVVTWLGMYALGIEGWLRRGEAFSILFGLFARFGPLELATAQAGGDERVIAADAGEFRATPRTARRIRLRPYGIGLLSERVPSASILVFVLVVLATVSFDGFADTPTWQTILQAAISLPLMQTLPSLVGLDNVRDFMVLIGILIAPVVFLLVYLAFCWVIALLVPRTWSTLSIAQTFVLTLVPIAIAYHLSHFLSLFLIFGQQIIPLVSDPFGYGWDLFGTADYKVDIAIIDARSVWIFSVIAIVVGHVAAVYLAHVTALHNFGSHRTALRSQYPMLALMVGYTMLSLWIIAQPIVEGDPLTVAGDDEGYLNAVAYEAGSSAPALSLTITADPDDGWNLWLETKNFRFTPENVSTEHRPYEGYAQLFVDNVQMARIYGPWHHIPDLPPGDHEVMVVLAANDHRTFMVNGLFVRDIVTLTVPAP